MRGLALPEDVLDKIYHANYERIVGASPRVFDAGLAAEECRRLASIARKPDEALAAADTLEK
jgi:hypothetical protein